MADKHFIPAFISQKRGMVYFLVLYAIASIIFFFIYHPLGMFGENGIISTQLDVQTYMIVLLLIGYIILIISRVLLYNSVHKHPDWSFGNVMLWVAIEFMTVDVLVTCTGLLLRNNDMVTFIRMLLRTTIDLIGLYMVPMLIVALVSVTLESSKNYVEVSKSYADLKARADALGEELETTRAEKEAHYREALAIKEQLKKHSVDVAMSQPVAENDKETASHSTLDMLRLTNRTGDFEFALPVESVLYVETVDNYVNVNYLDVDHVSSHIIRNTMKALEIQLSKYGFIRCHRQYLVNKQNIKSVNKERDGIIIHLKGCNRSIPVGKTFVSQLI